MSSPQDHEAASSEISIMTDLSSTGPNETTAQSWTTRRAWELYDYADDLLAQRMNYGMVAQAMLLLSFVTLFVFQKDIPTRYCFIAEMVLGIAGIFYSVFQFVRTYSLSKRLDFLRLTYLKDDPLWVEYSRVSDKSALILNMNYRPRQYTIPYLFIFVWLALLIVAAVRVYWPMPLG
jgi:hypothetical protein